jgi:hypothetical protein
MNFKTRNESGRNTLYADAEGLFEFLFGADLFVRTHKSRADSLDAAERVAFDEIQRGLAVIEQNELPQMRPGRQPWPWDYMPVDVRRVIPLEFSCFPVTAYGCNPGWLKNSIVSVSRQGGNWRLVLRNRWDHEVILDANFNLVSNRQLTTPKSERKEDTVEVRQEER